MHRSKQRERRILFRNMALSFVRYLLFNAHAYLLEPLPTALTASGGGSRGSGVMSFPHLTAHVILSIASDPASKAWPGSVRRRSDESVVDAIRTDVITDNDAVVVN